MTKVTKKRSSSAKKPPKVTKAPKPLKIKHGEHKGDELSLSCEGIGNEFYIILDCDYTCHDMDDLIYGDPKNARDIGNWLLKVADWAEER